MSDDTEFNMDDFEDVFSSVEDLEALPDNPFTIPSGTRRWKVTKVEHSKAKENKEKRDWPYWQFIFTVAPVDSEWAHISFKEWLHNPATKLDQTPQERKTISRAVLKNRLTVFGLSTEEILSFNPRTAAELLLNREFYADPIYVDTKDQNGNPRKNLKLINYKSLDDAEGGSSSHTQISDFDI